MSAMNYSYRSLVAIDPSMRNAGVTIAALPPGCEPIIHSVCQVSFPGGASDDYKHRAWQMCRHLVRAIELHCTDAYIVALETPTNWFTERGNASKDNEAVQRLYFFVGMLSGMLSETHGCCAVWGVEPGQWKGSTPKNIMVARAIKYLNLNRATMPDDAAESALLARFALTRLQGFELADPFRPIVPRLAGLPTTPCTFEEFVG